MIKKLASPFGLALIGVLCVALAVLFQALPAMANPFYTGTSAKSATATTTLTYMTPGAATTTTPIYDSYEQGGTNQTNSGNNTIPNTAAFILDGLASSTLTVVSAKCEFSDNYNPSTGNGDWYENNIFTGATTSNPVNIAVPSSFVFQYASSTIGGGAVGASTNRFQKLVTCPVPLRFVRLVVSVTGANAAIWRQIIPTKQRN